MDDQGEAAAAAKPKGKRGRPRKTDLQGHSDYASYWRALQKTYESNWILLKFSVGFNLVS